ncbi:uncharacterized protein LOC125044513 [Penaeus chinensis]|uniref:uncharacterized protein LOC125044513 n=1 Tax=Penaeus chinensis TaxID=139456 RepID=UPI001FB7E050|nr:uncharacterized protein LOC125044513 [Penaeus chinensis]
MATAQKCVISQCCCGCSLRRAALLIAAAFVLVDIAFWAYNVGELVKARLDWLLWTVFGLETANLIMDCVLLVGVLKENYRAIMAWVWVSVVQVVLTVIASIVSAFFVSPAPVSAAVVIAGVLFALAYSSAVVVVRSFGLTLRSSEESTA